MAKTLLLLVHVPMPKEVQGWLENFDLNLKTKGPTAIVHSLVQMGVDDPVSGEYWINESNAVSGEIGQWFQKPENQRYYNGVIWNMIQVSGKMAKIRQILRNDLKTTSEGEDMIGFGKIVEHAYAGSLLDYFVGNPKIRDEKPWY